MGNDTGERTKRKLSKVMFSLAMNVHLHDTFIGDRIGKLELGVDAEGNLLPSVIGAICVMLRSAPGTEISSARETPAFRKMLDFLDPYLESPYRPESDEIKPLPYLLYD